MHDLAKIFLNSLNQETLETPVALKQRKQMEDLKEYEMNYTRSTYFYYVINMLGVLTSTKRFAVIYAKIQNKASFCKYICCMFSIPHNLNCWCVYHGKIFSNFLFGTFGVNFIIAIIDGCATAEFPVSVTASRVMKHLKCLDEYC